MQVLPLLMRHATGSTRQCANWNSSPITDAGSLLRPTVTPGNGYFLNQEGRICPTILDQCYVRNALARAPCAITFGCIGTPSVQ